MNRKVAVGLLSGEITGLPANIKTTDCPVRAGSHCGGQFLPACIGSELGGKEQGDHFHWIEGTDIETSLHHAQLPEKLLKLWLVGQAYGRDACHHCEDT